MSPSSTVGWALEVAADSTCLGGAQAWWPLVYKSQLLFSCDFSYWYFPLSSSSEEQHSNLPGPR